MITIKYKLEERTSPSGTGLQAPECITDGGYLQDTDGTMIGYSDGVYPLSASCVELTPTEFEVYRHKVEDSRDCTIKSSGETAYTERADDGTVIAKVAATKVSIHSYLLGDDSCSFYSERSDGRKKYWQRKDITTDRYTQPDSNTQELSHYSEISGITQEWYYEFITFTDMMSFVNSHQPITLNPSLEARMKDDILGARPRAILNQDMNYLASVEVTASGGKITTIYVRALPEEIV
jgi:hypothetical protein